MNRDSLLAPTFADGLAKEVLMALKPPRGSAKPIHGAISQPKDVTQYAGVHGAISKAKDVNVANIGNSSMPPPKAS